ncbi:hypothetical protein ANCDUO_11570 [Ancylostoma duodenale]|uniref:Uncharacterized protein n=1 Tax=Ancylostoma duodenale TaxID=51022 RepID=A0A0C2GME1_9BILA|nr:hypothetical protein ANCDUO_11570 [Ancylostoma duodenale]
MTGDNKQADRVVAPLPPGRERSTRPRKSGGNSGKTRVFLFVGLVLTTLAVDVMGSACIERIHSIGRGLDAMALLRALKGAKGVIGNKSAPPTPLWFAFVPKDAAAIPYIDDADAARAVAARKTSAAAGSAKAVLLYDGGVEPSAAFLDAVASLDPDYDRVVCSGPEPIRQYLIPQIVREELEVPPVLLTYYDLSKVTSNSDSSGATSVAASSEVDFDEEARVMTSRLDTLSEGLCVFTCSLT